MGREKHGGTRDSVTPCEDISIWDRVSTGCRIDSGFPARDYHASPLLPFEEKDRKRRPTDKSNGSIFSSTDRERERFETREPREMGTVLEIDRSRDRERERGSVEDGDDRLHKRLERESLRRGFCARVPDG